MLCVSTLLHSLGLRAVSLHTYTMFCRSIPLLLGAWVVPTFWVIRIMRLWTWCASSNPCLDVFAAYTPKWNCWILWWFYVHQYPACSFPQRLHCLCISIYGAHGSNCPTISLTFLSSSCLVITTATTIAVLGGRKWFGVVLPWWIVRDVEHLLMCLLAVCMWQLDNIVLWTNIHLKFYLSEFLVVDLL